MNNWFTVKARYTKQLDNGAFKRVTEPYLLAAMTFTDAEARIYEELGSVIRGEFSVTGIMRSNINDIFAYSDTGVYFLVKVSYESFDSEKSKKVSQSFLVEANDVKEAYGRTCESLKGLMVDFRILSIAESPIVDILPYTEDLDREISRLPMEEKESVETESE